LLTEEEYHPFQSILAQLRDVDRYPEITRLATLYSGFRIYSEWSFGRGSSLREATATDRTDTYLSEDLGDLALALNGLQGSPAHDRIRTLLRELKETYRDYVTRILFGRVGLELQEAPFQRPLPAGRLSDGTLRFLALAAILLHPKPPPLLCLEEPELGMHPDMIRLVARMIGEAAARAQLLVTTHSEHLLTALEDDFDALFAFNAGLNGSVVRRFSRDDFAAWREAHSLGELWTSGELGGNRW
jgi:predicted ATPase